jgi:hypothetical protein
VRVAKLEIVIISLAMSIVLFPSEAAVPDDFCNGGGGPIAAHAENLLLVVFLPADLL